MKWIGLIGFIIVLGNQGLSQGCSDAGFCTLHGLQPGSDSEEIPPSHQLKIGSFWGAADFDISVYGSYLEYRRQWNSQWSTGAKLSSLGQSGNNISTFGLGDLFLSANYQFNEAISLTLGGKIPFNRGNRSLDGSALPMDYQSSLGTYDLIIGIGFQLGKLQISAGWQQPLIQNENSFGASRSRPINLELSRFPITAGFQRAGDVLLRLSYPFELNEKLRFSPSLLPIYHLANDRYQNLQGEIFDIEGSQGLTLNANVYFDYQLNSSNALQVNAGFPFLVREVRPDGLTRSFILNLEYQIAF